VSTNLLDSLAERNGHDLSGEALERNRDRNRSRVLVIETRRELGGLPGYLLLEVNQALQSGQLSVRTLSEQRRTSFTRP
jgi:hypothetical protein